MHIRHKITIISLLSILLLFVLSLSKEAVAITIGFENLSVGEGVLDQYSAEGIYFRDELSFLNGNSPGVIAATGYESSMALQPNDQSYPVYVLLTNPDSYFYFKSYVYEYSLDLEPPAGAFTVSFEFFKNDGAYQSIGFTSVSTLDEWRPVSFNSSERISAVKITGTRPFYVDNLQFETSGVVPEPATLSLLGLGLLGLVFRRKKTF